MIRYLLALLALITLISCSDDTSDKGKDPGNDQIIPVAQGEMIEKRVIKSGSYTFKSAEDTLDFTVTASDDKSYYFYTEDTYLDIFARVTSPGGVEYERKFACSESGTYRVKAYLSKDISEPLTIDYSFTEMNSTAPLNGKWLMTQKAYTTKDHSCSKLFSEESAHILMEIRNDSLFYTSFDNQPDGQSSGKAFIQSSLHNLKYRVDEKSLIFEHNNSYAHLNYSYKKFHGTIDDIVWEEELFEVQNEMIGSWYLAEEIYKSVEFEKGVMSSNPYIRTYNSAAESRIIYTAAENEVTIYLNVFDEDYSHETSSFSERHFLNNCRREGDNLIFERTNITFYGEQYYYVTYEKQVFTQYEGNPFPPEWSQISVPNEITPLQANREYSAAVKHVDTLWYEVDLETGFYDLEYNFNNDNNLIQTYLVNQSSMVPEGLRPYNEIAAGKYYLVLIPTVYGDIKADVPVRFSLKSL